MRTTQRRGAAALALAATAALLLAGGVAYATIPDPGGVIHGCYARSGGTLRVIDASVTNCKSTETSLDWNVQGQQGPVGPAGPAGPQGPAGPAGPQGPAGVSHAYAVTGGGKAGIGTTPVLVESISLPAGAYVLWSTASASDFTDDSGSTCALKQGTTVLGTGRADTFATGLNTDRLGFASIAITASATLVSAGTVDLYCSSSDGSANASVIDAAVTAIPVDALN